MVWSLNHLLYDSQLQILTVEKYLFHGLMTYQLHIEGEGWSQAFGGRHIGGSAFGIESIRRVLETMKVDKWEDLRGCLCRVRRAEEYGALVAIGHIIEDRWYNGEQHAREPDSRASG